MKAVILPNGDEQRNVYDPGVVYMAAIEGDREFVVNAAREIWDSRSFFSSFLGIFELEHLGWDISGEMAADPSFQALMEELDLPGQ